MSPAPALAWVTGLRGVAAFYVLCSHVWYQIWPAVPPPYGHGRYPPDAVAAFTGWLYYGHFAVVVFICLSGYCLMLRVLQDGGTLPDGARGFWRRRAWRLLPPYYAALALSLLLCVTIIGHATGSQWDISVPVTWQGVVSHLLLLNDVLEATQINYVYWSIALEVHLCLLFPLWVKAWQRLGACITVGTSCVLVYGAVALLEVLGVREVPPQFIGLVACFVIGMAAASLSKDAVMPRAFLELVGWALWASVVALCATWEHAISEQRFALLDLLCALGTAALMMAASQGKGLFVRLMQTRACVACGYISYSLYLVHAPLIHLLWLYGVSPWIDTPSGQFVALLLIAPPVCVAFAWQFHVAVERPFLQSHRRAPRQGRSTPRSC